VRILVVDDEPAVRESLVSSLTVEDDEVGNAVDGLDALSELTGSRRTWSSWTC
jgi:two-component system response regulator MprA